MKNKVLLQVLASIILAVIAGWLTGPNMEIFGMPIIKIYSLIGQLFINALTLIIVPLVTSSIITGTAKMGGEPSFGKLGAKTFGYFITTNALAILVGLLFFLLISPGASQSGSAPLINIAAGADFATMPAVQEGLFDKIAQIFLKIIPANIFAVASQGQMLGLISFSLLFGYFLSKIEEHPASVVLGFFKGIFQIMMGMTHLVMQFLPIGVFGLVAKVAATTGVETITSVALFFATVLISLFCYAFIVLPLMLMLIGHLHPLLHFRAVAPALLTAFSTSSSAATLPVTLECMEQRAGVSNRITSFILPLGTSLNLSGSALYQCVAVLFIAQAYGVPLTLPTLFVVVLMSLVTAFGIAGIPSASLVSAVIILNTIGAPAEGIGLVMAVERLLDMCRTPVSVLGTTCCTVLIAISEGERDVLTNNPTTIRQVNG